jgi:hypothetical protein
MPEQRFPYEKNSWHGGDAAAARRWYEVLERTGVENVRAVLARNTAGSRASIAIGAESNMTKGFAEEWLYWHDQQKAKRETVYRTRQLKWMRWAALAAIAGVVVAVLVKVYPWILKHL